jgi:hypothetical protein
MSVTARAILTGALKLGGVLGSSETLATSDGADGLILLNNLVDSWNLENLNLYTVTEQIATFSGKTATIGPAMVIACTRPSSIDSAFYRRSQIDYPLRIIDYAEYNSISMKGINSDFPEVMYYDGGSPTGNVYVWPVPTSNEYHLMLNTQLSEFADLDTSYSLPQGYRKALMYTVAPEFLGMFNKTLSPRLEAVGINARRVLRRANVRALSLDTNLPGNHAQVGRINILSNR